MTDLNQLENDIRRLQQDRDIQAHQIDQLQRNQAASSRWAIRVSDWIKQHVGGHVTAANEAMDDWMAKP